MAYTATTWVNGSVPAVSAVNLNNIEQGIVSTIALIEELKMMLSMGAMT